MDQESSSDFSSYYKDHSDGMSTEVKKDVNIMIAIGVCSSCAPVDEREDEVDETEAEWVDDVLKAEGKSNDTDFENSDDDPHTM